MSCSAGYERIVRVIEKVEAELSDTDILTVFDLLEERFDGTRKFILESRKRDDC
jgi:hypothetical protein